MRTALIFHFPYHGPWGQAMVAALGPLALDIAGEDGLVFKLWLEDEDYGRAGGIYLFEDAASAERYRAKHEARLAASGHAGVEVIATPINIALSALTGAGFVVAKAA